MPWMEKLGMWDALCREILVFGRKKLEGNLTSFVHEKMLYLWET